MKKRKDVNDMTKSELLYEAKRTQNNLIRRRKTLQERREQSPGDYSPFGLKELEGYTTPSGEVKEGIPSVSKNDNINDLRAKVKRLNHLNSLRTTRAQGAKEVQREQIRLMSGLPTTGRLNAEDQRKYNEAKRYHDDNPEAMTTFWQAFEFYKQEAAYRNLDSDQLLEEIRPVIQQARKDGYDTMADLAAVVEDYVEEMYLESQEEEPEFAELERMSKFRGIGRS